MNKKIIIGVVWKTVGITTIGFVAVNSFNGWKAYCGIGGGHDEEEDCQIIANIGAKMLKNEAVGFFPNLDPKQFEL